MSPVAILGLLLAISVAGNAWQFHHGEVILEAKAATTQLAADTKAAADACSAGVDDLAKAGRTRGKALIEAMKQVAPTVQALQEAAIVAQRAKPDDPKDLCGSLERYLRTEVAAERASK